MKYVLIIKYVKPDIIKACFFDFLKDAKKEQKKEIVNGNIAQIKRLKEENLNAKQ